MKEIIEIKRKEFTILEQIGEHSFKVERKDKIYFLKKWEGNAKGFIEFEKNQLVLKNSGITIPKVYMWDKKSMISVVDYVDGPSAFDVLIKEELDEKYIEQLFLLLYRAKLGKIYLDFDPRNFIVSDEKLIYIPFKYTFGVAKDEFLNNEYYLWKFTKKFVKFAHSLGVDVDESRLKSDGQTTKEMTLLAVKYYR